MHRSSGPVAMRHIRDTKWDIFRVLPCLFTISAFVAHAAAGQDLQSVGLDSYAVWTTNAQGDSNKGFVVGRAGVLLIDVSAA